MEKIRKNLKEIYTAAIEAVNPHAAIKNHVQLDNNKLLLLKNSELFKVFDLSEFEKIYVVGAGKATASMAKAVESILGDKISEGVICVKYDYTEDLDRIQIMEASHPIPDENGVAAAKKIRALLQKAGEKDLIISLISGGGSALLPLPPDPITLAEKGETTNLLLKSGASIHEINSIRKHLSCIKGGNSAREGYPGTVINLMISDVVGDQIDVIASGPFVPDNSSFEMALEILHKYTLTDKVPGSVIDYIKKGTNGEIKENPDEDDSCFEKITNLVIASNIISLKSAEAKAKDLGYNTLILSSLIEGDTMGVSLVHSRILKECLHTSNPIQHPACIISGGETTVNVKGNGLGGRNMEFAIQAAEDIKNLDGVIMASIGTDGSDGPTDAAGAVIDGTTIMRSEKKGINIKEYIKNNDSYNFFKQIDDLIITGPTNTNVMDVRLILID